MRRSRTCLVVLLAVAAASISAAAKPRVTPHHGVSAAGALRLRSARKLSLHNVSGRMIQPIGSSTIALGVVAGVGMVALSVLGALVYQRRTAIEDSPVENVANDTFNSRAGEPIAADEDISEESEEELRRKRRRTGPGYRRGDMVAARRTATHGFSVAAITRVHRDANMRIDKLTVRWYKAYGGHEGDVFEASYSPAWRDNKPWEDTITVNSVFLRFSSLKRDNCLPTEVRGVLGDPNIL